MGPEGSSSGPVDLKPIVSDPHSWAFPEPKPPGGVGSYFRMFVSTANRNVMTGSLDNSCVPVRSLTGSGSGSAPIPIHQSLLGIITEMLGLQGCETWRQSSSSSSVSPAPALSGLFLAALFPRIRQQSVPAVRETFIPKTCSVPSDSAGSESRSTLHRNRSCCRAQICPSSCLRLWPGLWRSGGLWVGSMPR